MRRAFVSRPVLALSRDLRTLGGIKRALGRDFEPLGWGWGASERAARRGLAARLVPLFCSSRRKGGEKRENAAGISEALRFHDESARPMNLADGI